MIREKHTAGRLAGVIGRIVGGLALAILIAFVFGFVVMWLWNWLMPGLFGLATIDFWQAFALIVLARLLVGGVGHHGGPHPHPWHRRDFGDFPGGKGFFHHHPHGFRHKFWKHHGMETPEDWILYREYWEEKGKSDFENFRKERKQEQE